MNRWGGRTWKKYAVGAYVGMRKRSKALSALESRIKVLDCYAEPFASRIRFGCLDIMLSLNRPRTVFERYEVIACKQDQARYMWESVRSTNSEQGWQ